MTVIQFKAEVKKQKTPNLFTLGLTNHVPSIKKKGLQSGPRLENILRYCE